MRHGGGLGLLVEVLVIIIAVLFLLKLIEILL